MAGDATGAYEPPGELVARVGVEHVRLSYEYLDRHDIDGYGSLFDADAVLRSPVAGVVRGRAEIESYQAKRPTDAGRHVLDGVFGSAGRVFVVGRLTGPGRQVEFLDLFTLTEHGMLLSQKSYFFAAPS
jgi:hypothetical protein